MAGDDHRPFLGEVLHLEAVGVDKTEQSLHEQDFVSLPDQLGAHMDTARAVITPVPTLGSANPPYLGEKE